MKVEKEKPKVKIIPNSKNIIVSAVAKVSSVVLNAQGERSVGISHWEVIAVGSDVKNYKVGDKVIIASSVYKNPDTQISPMYVFENYDVHKHGEKLTHSLNGIDDYFIEGKLID